MFDIDALARQLVIPTHGVARRRELLRRAQLRFDRELLANASAYFETGKTIVALMDQRQRLAEMHAEFGIEKARQGNAVTADPSDDVEVYAAEQNMEGASIDDLIIRTPLHCPGPYANLEPMAISVPKAISLRSQTHKRVADQLLP